MRRFKGEKGFTLVELMVVILIIGILVAIAIPVYNAARAKAWTGACQANMRTLDGAIETYYATNEAYPASIAALAPDYIREVPTCPQSSGVYTWVGESAGVVCPDGHTY